MYEESLSFWKKLVPPILSQVEYSFLGRSISLPLLFLSYIDGNDAGYCIDF